MFMKAMEIKEMKQINQNFWRRRDRNERRVEMQHCSGFTSELY